MKVLLPVLLLTCFAVPVDEAVAEQPLSGAFTQQFDLNIPSQPLAAALIDFDRQTGLTVVIASGVGQHVVTPHIEGRQTPVAALDLMLENSGLRVAYLDAKTAEVVAAPPLAGRPKVARPPIPPATHAQRIEEVVVTTGTRIHELRDLPTPLTVYSRETIDASGASSPQQFMQAVPQNFGGGDLGASEEGKIGAGSMSALNVSSGSGINLRGLGNTATLVLVNGHRVAPSMYGATPDISLIPLTSVQSIEVVSDGMSAIYGSDAVAGVVNFKLRENFAGAETAVRYGSVTDGTLQETLVSQLVGLNWQQGGAVVAVQYRDRDALPSAERSAAATTLQPTDLLPQSRQYSATLVAHEDVTSNLKIHADALGARSDVNRNYATDDQRQYYEAETQHENANAGVDYKLPGDWNLGLSGTYSRDIATLTSWFNPTDPLYVSGEPYLVNRFILQSAEFVADGGVIGPPGRRVKVSVGASYRGEEFSSRIPWMNRNRPFNRTVTAEFAEIHVPLIGENSDALPFIQRLTFYGAIRSDRYSDFGSTTNPSLGILWVPFQGLRIKASHSQSFQAPFGDEEVVALTARSITTRPFATPGGGMVNGFFLSGSKALLPEKSYNDTVGLEYAPPWATGLRLSIDYYHIRFQDRIVLPPVDLSAPLRPGVYGSLLTPLQDDTAAQAYLANALAQGYSATNGITANGVRYAYADVQQNAGRVIENGVDASLEYKFQLGMNELIAKLNAAYIGKIETQFTAASEPIDVAGTYGNPVRMRMRGELGWKRGQWQANSGLNFTSGYDDTSAIAYARVGSWTTVDTQVRFTPDALKGLSVALNVINLFARDPPLVAGLGASGVHYDTANATALGRFVSMEVYKLFRDGG